MKNKMQAGVVCRHTKSYTEADRGSKCSHKYELIYLVSGNGSLKIEGSVLPFDNETVYLIKPLTYYEICVDDGNVLDRYHVSFSMADLKDNLSVALKSIFEESSACAIIKDFSSTELRRVFSGISFANKLSSDAKAVYLSSMLQQIAIIISAAKNKRSHSGSNEFASQVADFISEAIENNKFLTLEEIAKTFFVSKFYLCRMFKSYSGISVHAYINRKRILLAKQYIDSGMSAGLAAEAVGYQDYSAFYRAYVNVMGVSPKSKKG